MSALSELLVRANANGLSARSIARQAQEAGFKINHDTAARYLRGDHGRPEEVSAARSRMLPMTAYAQTNRRRECERIGRYDPWLDVRLNWPAVRVVIERMTGDLLGEVRDGGAVIALRAGTSAAQRRCTLAHEIVHLERGLRDCGQWLHREEQAVHRTAARRLITVTELAAAIRDLGTADDHGA